MADLPKTSIEVFAERHRVPPSTFKYWSFFFLVFLPFTTELAAADSSLIHSFSRSPHSFPCRLRNKDRLRNPTPNLGGRRDLRVLTDRQEEDLAREIRARRQRGEHVDTRTFLLMVYGMFGLTVTLRFFYAYAERHGFSLRTPSLLAPPAADSKSPEETLQQAIDCLTEYHETVRGFNIDEDDIFFVDEMKVEWDFQRTKTIDEKGKARAHVQGMCSF